MVRLLLAVLLTGFAELASADAIATRFGQVTAQRAVKSSSDFVVAFAGVELARVAADAITLRRVTTSVGNDEYVIVEKTLPGLHCHYEYMLVSVDGVRGTSRISPPFANCLELEGARAARDSVKLTFHSPFIDGVARHQEHYVWAGGRLRKLRRSASA